MSERVVLALLTPVRWAPPGVDPVTFRAAMAEDVVDLIAALAQADAAIAATATDRDLAAAIAWPSMRVFELPAATPRAALEAAAAHGYGQAGVLCADAPDLPGLLVGKLMQPLSSRPVAIAPAHGGGLLGVASRLPAPGWLPDLDVDADLPERAQQAAPRRTMVAATPGWHRIRGATDLRRLDPALEGWASTRALLS